MCVAIFLRVTIIYISLLVSQCIGKFEYKQLDNFGSLLYMHIFTYSKSRFVCFLIDTLEMLHDFAIN